MTGQPKQSTGARSFIGGDPLRAVAALSVLVYHVAYFSLVAAHQGWFVQSYGRFAGAVIGSLHLGLFLFFVMSGYLISSPFVRAFVAGAPLPRVRPYVRHRLLRIVPTFWIILTIVLLCWGPMGSSIGQLAAVYGFAQNYTGSRVSQVVGQGWTLDVEIAFYLLVPIITAVVMSACRRFGAWDRRHVLFAALTAAAVGSLTFRAFAPGISSTSGLAWQTSLPAMAFAFTPGVALAAIETTDLPRRLRRSCSLVPAAMLLAAGIAVLAIYAARAQRVTPPFVDAVGGCLAALGTGSVVAAVLVLQWSTGRCWKALDNRAMRWIGERSYSLYLVHQPLIFAVVFTWTTLGPSPWTRLEVLLPLLLAVSLASAALSYRYFERPFLRIRTRAAGAPEPTTHASIGTQQV